MERSLNTSLGGVKMLVWGGRVKSLLVHKKSLSAQREQRRLCNDSRRVYQVTGWVTVYTLPEWLKVR